MKFVVTLLTAALTIGATTAPASAQPRDPTFDCNSEGGGQCVNNGSFAHGWEPNCYAPDNVLVVFAYYGHVNGQFPDVHYTQHFYYDGAPFWQVWYFDRDDSMNGFRVWWSMGGPPQHYAGENHLLYNVNVYCEPHDGPKLRIGVPNESP